MINPSSVHSGLEVSNNFENYKVKVRGNRKGGQIILTPDEEWLGDEILYISLNNGVGPKVIG